MQKNDLWALPKHYGRSLTSELYFGIEESKRKLRIRKNICRAVCAVVIVAALVILGV